MHVMFILYNNMLRFNNKKKNKKKCVKYFKNVYTIFSLLTNLIILILLGEKQNKTTVRDIKLYI